MKKTITLNKYQYHDEFWWKGRKALIQKDYKNAFGDIIEKDSIVTIGWKMETKRFDEKLHEGLFFVSDFQGNVVGGVNCDSLILLSEFSEMISFCEN